MNTTQKIFLAQFDQPIRKHIIQFCNALSKTNYDVYILLARKAACFISELEECGLLSLKGYVVSERILEYDTSWLEGKSIAIVDDTIISGTSIYKIINKLKSINNSHFGVHAFCINDFWFVDEMLSDEKHNFLLEPYLRLDHTTTIRFCKQIVNSLSLIPRPYSTDFPIYEKIKLTKHNLLTLLEDENWKIIDTTTPLQEQFGISCMSLNPRKKVLNEFIETIGADFKEVLFIKVRLYLKKVEKDTRGNFSYIAKAVPFIIFNPIDYEFVNKLIVTICECEKIEKNSLIDQLRTESSKLLFLQYYFSERLFKWWFSYTESILDKKIKHSLNERSLYLLFSPKLVDIISHISFEAALKLPIGNTSEMFLHENIDYNKPGLPINPLKVKERLLDLFLDFYYNKELPARRIVRRMKKEAFFDTQYNEIINRLEDGISMSNLKKEVSKLIDNSTDTNLILSTFLDNAVDSGIIVPITVYRGNYLYRGYRHGEEIIWGNYNDKLLGVFFNSFLNSTQSKSLSKFWFEKLLVLFLKMGLKEGILEEYNLITPVNQKVSLIGIRTYLFGEITISYEIEPYSNINYNPILDFETKSYWTSDRYKDLGIIILNDDNHYELKFENLSSNQFEKLKDSNEPNDLDEGFIDKTTDIAELLAICKKEKLIDETGLVLITSCINIFDNTSSLAAELHLFNQNNKSYSNYIKGKLRDNDFSIEFLRSLRDRTSNFLWTAINSGTYKYFSYKTGKGIELINKISDHLNNIDGFKKRAWNKLWRQEVELSKNELNELNPLNDRMGLILSDINITIIYIHLIIYELIKRLSIFEKFLRSNINEIEKISTIIQEKHEKINQISTHLIKDNQVQIDFPNGKVIEQIQLEINKLLKRKSSLNKANDYWINYVDVNLDQIKSYLKHNLLQKNSTLRSINLINELTTGTTFECSDNELKNNILKSLESLECLSLDAKSVLEEFNLLVPQWGKIQKKVKYSSVIHINSSSTDKADREKISLIVKKVVSAFELAEFHDQINEKSIMILRINSASEGDGYIIGGKGQFHKERMLKLCCNLLAASFESGIKTSISFFPQFQENGIIAYFNKQTNRFDIVTDNLFKYLPINNRENIISIFAKNEIQTIKDYINILVSSFKNKFKIEEINEDQIKYIVKMDNMNLKPTKTIGVVTALPKEFAAMKLVLDFLEPSIEQPLEDKNDYVKGHIKNLDGTYVEVIIALMKEFANNNAASTATNLLRSFPQINEIIMTGIAGGIPNLKNPNMHVRLGDIVVTNKDGILQYDNVKKTVDEITIRDASPKPSSYLLGKVNLLTAEFESNNYPWLDYIKKYEGKLRNSVRPDEKEDILKMNGIEVDHPVDNLRIPNTPRVFNGPIGSSNTLLKDEKTRDSLAQKYGLLAIEMEGSGIADGTWTLSKGYLVVRGIVDYCNSDKNDKWHNYASICAACYTRCIIERL